MANTKIALFRGINVGGRNVIKMKELKELLLSKGLTNVNTYIQSGNVFLTVKIHLSQILLLILWQ
jgi:uncharacterized protein (DUF1697 family)